MGSIISKWASGNDGGDGNVDDVLVVLLFADETDNDGRCVIIRTDEENDFNLYACTEGKFLGTFDKRLLSSA